MTCPNLSGHLSEIKMFGKFRKYSSKKIHCMFLYFIFFYCVTMNILSGINFQAGVTKGVPNSRFEESIKYRSLQKRERTGKEYGCFPFVWKTKIFKWKINYILESLPRIEIFGGAKWQNGCSTNITQNREFVWIG